MPDPFEIPVVMFAYNRLETTSRVFAEIRRARPGHLVIVADGPLDLECDRQRTQAVRELLAQVDWPCEVMRDYADRNLGLRRRFEGGMRNVFDRFEAAIVLEDDCLPHPSFFPFCHTLLRRYREHSQVLSLTGTRVTPVRGDASHSYAFSRYTSSCGWGTWRRAWRLYDPDMSAWPKLMRTGWLTTEFGSSAAAYWAHILDSNWREPSTRNWDYAWLLSSWDHGGLNIVPHRNLVSNIGFGAGATHTTDPRSIFASLPAGEMAFPLRHPPSVERSPDEDALVESCLYSGNLDRLFDRLRSRVRQSELRKA